MYRMSLIPIYSWMDDQQQIPGWGLRGHAIVHKYKIEENVVSEGVPVEKKFDRGYLPIFWILMTN